MSPKVVDDALHFKTAGFSDTDDLTFRAGPSRCGGLVGVSFNHDKDGGWVVSYEDFDRMVEAVKLAREKEAGAVTRH